MRLRSATKFSYLKNKTTAGIVSAISLALSSIAYGDSCNLSTSNLDWVPYSELSPIQQAALGTGCCGAYVVPPEYQLLVDSSTNTDSINIDAEDSSIEDGGNTTVLIGNVQIRQGPRLISAQRATISKDQDNGSLSTDVRFRVPGMLLAGEHAEITLSDGNAAVYNSSFVVHETGLRGSADRIGINEAKTLDMINGGVTSCSPGDDSWYLASDEISLDSESGLGTVKHATLELNSVPVLYIPWAQFPIDDRRMSGMLFPSISGGSDGLDISVPIYLNLAPDYDATLTPRYIAERGTGLESEFRYLTQNQMTVVSGAHWNHDDLTQTSRWLIGLDHDGGEDQNWYSKIDYAKVSDIDYFRDLDTYGIDVSAQDNLRQHAAVGYKTDAIHLGVELNQYQALSVTTQNLYRELPRTWIEVNQNVFFGVNISGGIESTEFKAYRGLDLDEGRRNNAFLQASFNREWLPGYIRAGTRIDSVQYDITQAPNGLAGDDKFHTTVPRFWAGGGLYFERLSHGEEDSIVLEPELFYVYAPFRDQSNAPLFDTTLPYQTYKSLFNERHFTGGDRLGDSNRVTLGTKARFINNLTGDEWLTLGVAQAFYLEHRQVALQNRLTPDVVNGSTHLPDLSDGEKLELETMRRNQSDLIFNSRIRLNDQWNWTSEINWDTSDDQVNRNASYLQYSKYREALVNIGLIYQRNSQTPDNITGILTDRDTYQTLVSAYVPIGDQGWAAFGRWVYDVTYSSNLDFLGGIEYDTCCWRVALGYQVWVDSGTASEIRELEDRSAIRFQFELKGIGSGLSAVDRLLSSISGYDDYEKNN